MKARYPFLTELNLCSGDIMTTEETPSIEWEAKSCRQEKEENLRLSRASSRQSMIYSRQQSKTSMINSMICASKLVDMMVNRLLKETEVENIL